jgi:hypothetical protein
MDEWIKKMWNIYTMEFYSAMKNKIMSSSGKWTELEIISNKLDSERQISHVFSHIWNTDLKNDIKVDDRLFEKEDDSRRGSERRQGNGK